MSLDDLRSDLAQVAPAKTEEDLDVFASELKLLLSKSESEREKTGSVLDKKALWERVTAEIDRHEESGGDPAPAELFTTQPHSTDNPTTQG